ncbi:hypothetical protein [Microvirga brassicacearum]|nr:hypothetical protein [Microvirga brassicacearum]
MRNMNSISRFLFATACGVVLGIAVHIVVVLASPRFAEGDAIARVRSTLESETAQIVSPPGGGATWLPLPDPALAIAACAFDLNEGPARIAAKTGETFLSFSLHSKTSGVFFAVTDRAAIRGELELVIMTPRQLDEARAEEDENEPSRDVRIVAPEEQGYVIVRVAAPVRSLRPAATRAAEAVSCTVDGEGGEE